MRSCREIVLIPFMSIVWLRWNKFIIARILNLSSELTHVGTITSVLLLILDFLSSFLWFLSIVTVHSCVVLISYRCLLLIFFLFHKQVRLLQNLLIPLKSFIFYVSLYKMYFFVGLGCLVSYRFNNSQLILLSRYSSFYGEMHDDYI